MFKKHVFSITLFICLILTSLSRKKRWIARQMYYYMFVFCFIFCVCSTVFFHIPVKMENGTQTLAEAASEFLSSSEWDKFKIELGVFWEQCSLDFQKCYHDILESLEHPSSRLERLSVLDCLQFNSR